MRRGPMRSRGIALSTAFMVVLVLTLTSGLTVLAQEDTDQSQGAADPQQPVSTALPIAPAGFDTVDSPQLACGVQLVRTPASDFQSQPPLSAAYTCWVGGAPLGDTSFSAEVARTDTAGALHGVAEVCVQSPLVDGSGSCRGVVTNAAGPVIGGAFVTATLQPSGTQLGPISISPTRAGL